MATKLLNKNIFINYKSKLPTDYIKVTVGAFPMINKTKLETEIGIFYGRTTNNSDLRSQTLFFKVTKNKN